MRRAPVSALSVLALGAVAGCSLILGSSSDLEDALEVAPAGATTVTYVGRAAAAEREGVDDVETGADGEEVERYLESVSPSGATRLTSYLRSMQEAAFSDLDVEWEVSGLGADAAPFVVWKIDDDLDLDEVGDDLVDAGYEESEVGGHRAFRAERDAADAETQLVGDRYPVAVMGELVLVPDEHLVIVGAEAGAVLEVVEDDEDSLVDSRDFEAVVGAADDAEYAFLQRDLDCAVGLGTAAADDPEALVAELGLEDLRRPEATAFFVRGDDAETTTVLEFEDEDAAEADAEARRAWLEDGGVLLRTREPVGDVAEWRLETDDSLVVVDHEFEGGLDTAMQVAHAGDGFTLCAP